METSLEVVILCSTRWLKIEVTARQKKRTSAVSHNSNWLSLDSPDQLTPPRWKLSVFYRHISVQFAQGLAASTRASRWGARTHATCMKRTAEQLNCRPPPTRRLPGQTSLTPHSFWRTNLAELGILILMCSCFWLGNLETPKRLTDLCLCGASICDSLGFLKSHSWFSNLSELIWSDATVCRRSCSFSAQIHSWVEWCE